MEYKRNYVKGKPLAKNNLPKKIKGQITIQTKKGDVKFHDDYNNGSYVNYKVCGTDTATRIIFIVSTGYHDCDGFLVNMTTGKVDTTLGDPFIYSDKIVSFDQVPDSRGKIQVMNYSRYGVSNAFTLVVPFCDEKNETVPRANVGWIDWVYLREDTLYIKSGKCFYKLDIKQ